MRPIPVVGVNFSAGMGSVVSQLNAALGTNLQFSNPSGTVLQVLNNGSGQHVNSLSATSTVTSLTAATRNYRCLPTAASRLPAP